MFYYRAGDISTTTRWEKPTKKSFNSWLCEWRKVVELNNYNIYLTGGFCEKCFSDEKRQTWDVDLFITPIKSLDVKYVELKNVLEQAMYIGFKHKLLIDIWYNDICYDIFKDSKTTYTSPISIVSYSETEMKTNEGEFNTKADNAIEIIPGLYKVFYDIEKIRNKFKDKDYQIPYYKLNVLSPKLQL